MHFGDIEVLHISGGNFYLDGGAMFGVVPKPLWAAKSVPDERNRIRLAASSLLIRTAGKIVLVETGNGTKWTAKLRDIYGIAEGDPLVENLAKIGVTPGQIDLVVNTHLHFDHAGGNTKLSGDRFVPTFPNARYFVQAGELEHALHPSERDRASYFAENVLPMQQSGQWFPVNGDTEILPGISVEGIPGHNADIQAIKISGGGKTVVFVADLLPTRHHVALPWIMAYDLYPMQTLETKRKWVERIVREEWVVVFGHDPDIPAATLHHHDDKTDVSPVNFND